MPVTDASFSTLVSGASSRTERHNKQALKKGLAQWDFEIDEAYLHSVWKAQDGYCNLCGVQMDLIGETHVYGSANMLAASVDRIDTMQGYVKSNIALVHFVCNSFKNQLSTQYVYAIARGIVSLFEKRYPELRVAIANDLVTKDNVKYYAYPTFTYEASGKIQVSGGSGARITPNLAPAPPQNAPVPPADAPGAG